MGFPSYFEAVDHQRIAREYPLGDAFVEKVARLSRDELRNLQNQRFLRLMVRGWQISFYRRLWGEHGLEPGDIESLDDIGKLPVFGKAELMASIERNPPFGDPRCRNCL